MITVKNLAEANTALYKYFPPPTSMKEAYSLDRMYSLMDLLGNPQNKLKIIHVAGTSGKTSTCYYTAALLKAAGKKVGLTVSPHIDKISERVQINLVPLADDTFSRYFTEFLNIPGLIKLQPSYFEAVVAFAFWVFVREKVDYAVIEVGVGGIGDATNVIDRADKVCVLTDIGYDHMKILGDTIQKITAQKAGIIQDQNSVLTLQQEEVVLDVVKRTVQTKQAKLTIIKTKKLPLLANLPPFGQRNWQLAHATYQLLAKRDGLIDLPDDQLTKTTQIIIPARMEVIKLGSKVVVLDGSHNQQKLAALRLGMEARFGDQPIALLTSFVQSRGDRLQDALNEIIPLVSSVIVTSYDTKQDFRHQSLPLQEIAKVCKTAGATDVITVEDPRQAFEALLNRPEKVLLVTGSFYLLNHIRPALAQKIG